MPVGKLKYPEELRSEQQRVLKHLAEGYVLSIHGGAWKFIGGRDENDEPCPPATRTNLGDMIDVGLILRSGNTITPTQRGKDYAREMERLGRRDRPPAKGKR